MSPIARAEIAQPDSDYYVGAFFVAVIVFGGGFWVGVWSEARKPKPVVEAKVVYRTPLVQFQCTATERKEYLEACKQRARSALIKP